MKAELTGNKYNRLLVVSHAHTTNKRVYWKCLCDCGKTKVVQASQLKSGKTKSCGCYNLEKLVERSTTHGMGGRKNKTAEYTAYHAMLNRCYNENGEHYKDWGGRGIKVCDRWLLSFDNFLSDMGSRPSNNHSLDRKDNSKGYSPENCRWATKPEQASNTRRNRLILNVETGIYYTTLVEAATVHGMTRGALEQRINRNKSKNLIDV